MSATPWTRGPGEDGLWICPEDRLRVDRYNARLPADDGRRVRYLTSAGRPMYPGQWSGNAWSAPVLLLLLNPAFSDDLDEVYGDPEVQRRVDDAVRGQWAEDYPLQWLHPAARVRDPWCANIPFAALHRHLTSQGEEPEAAWRRISRKCAILELGPWASFKWSAGAICSTTQLSIRLAAEAMADPSRVVLLGRGEDDWKTAGLIDADLLPKSLGVRVNQSRITPANFPETWRRILQLVEK